MSEPIDYGVKLPEMKASLQASVRKMYANADENSLDLETILEAVDALFSGDFYMDAEWLDALWDCAGLAFRDNPSDRQMDSLHAAIMVILAIRQDNA